MAKREDILAAISALDLNDKSNWGANGVPNLDVIRKLTRDAKVSAADVAAALATAPVEVQQRVGGVDPLNPHVNPPTDANQRAALPEATKEDRDEEKEKLQLAHETVAAMRPSIEALLEKKKLLDKEIAAITSQSDKAVAVIEELTPKLTDAEMVKRIQKQTFDTAVERAARASTIAAVARFAPGARTFSSPLDAALAAGDPRRRSVAIVNGQPIQAASPRSPEGVRAYANWIHTGSGRGA